MSDHRKPNSTSTPEIPTDEDRKAYQFDVRTSEYWNGREHEFLNVGDKVRAKIRIWDLPNNEGASWGWITADKGEVGVCENSSPGFWPFVRFENGLGTDVTPFEGEKI